MPTFIVISEYDNPDLDTQGALLFGALCERNRACPRFTRMELHNHLSMVYQFNTADDALGRQILKSSGAVGDLRSRPSWLKVIYREAPRLAPIIRPPVGDEGVCLLSSTAMSDLQIE